MKKGENSSVKFVRGVGGVGGWGSWLCIFRGRGEQTPHTSPNLLPHAFVSLRILATQVLQM